MIARDLYGRDIELYVEMEPIIVHDWFNIVKVEDVQFFCPIFSTSCQTQGHKYNC